MAKVLFTTALVSLIALIAFLIPQLQYANKLINITTDFSPYAASLSSFNSTCTPQHRGRLVGCEDLHLVGTSIYTACEAGLPLHNRQKWGRAKNTPLSHIPADKLYRWDLPADRVVELQLQNFPTPGNTAADRSFLGLDVNERADGTVSIYVINLLPTGNVIEKFHHDPKTEVAVHIARFRTDHPHAAWAPDDVFALPEHDDDNAFFVTCDHGSRHPVAQELEYFLRRPWSWVSFHSDSTGWKIALPNVVAANGITGDKNAHGRRIYLSEVANGNLKVLEMPEYGKLEPLQDVFLGHTGDNPSLAPAGDVYIPGAARAHLLKPYLRDEAPEFQSTSPDARGPGSIVKRVRFGAGAPPRVEDVVVDGNGVLANFSTTALFVPQGNAGGKGDLYLTGLKFDGVLKCTGVK